MMLPSPLMCDMSMEEGFAALHTLRPLAFPASRFQSLVNGLVSRMNATCSERSSEWLMKLGSDSSFSKTFQDSCAQCGPSNTPEQTPIKTGFQENAANIIGNGSKEPSEESRWISRQNSLFSQPLSETWLDSFPRAGFVSNGSLWERKMSELRTAGNGGGRSPTDNWTTPQSRDFRGASGDRLERFADGSGKNLNDEVDKWSTPKAARGGWTNSREGKRLTLDGEAKNWATPRAEDSQHAGAHGDRVDSVNAQVRLWPTPRMNSCRGEGQHGEGSPDLQTAVGKNWPTPDALDKNSTGEACDQRRLELYSTMGLQNAVKQWPTPCATDDIRGMNEFDGKRGQTLLGAVRGQPWSSPMASDANMGAGTRNSPGQTGITNEVKKWGTPRSNEHKGSGVQGTAVFERQLSKGYLDAQVMDQKENGDKGMLNPNWEEILMCWPIGWTDWENPCAGIWPGWPMGQGPQQYDYEPLRTMPKGAVPNRTKRIEMIGNGVVWVCAAAAFYQLLGGEDVG